MALAKKRSPASRLVIIAAVVIAVAGIGYVLFREFFLTDRGLEGNANAANRSKSVITNFGESILNDPRYTTLKSYDMSVNADANRDGGQVNPFR